VQEQVDFSDFDGPVKDLVQKGLLNHSDRGVQIYAACCLADLFRLYASRNAPPLPFSDSILKVRPLSKRCLTGYPRLTPVSGALLARPVRSEHF